MSSHVVSYFRSVDPVLSSVLDRIEIPTLVSSDTPFFSLIESIISQQLSVKAGDTIVKRFLTLIPNQKVTPEAVLKIPREKLREVGMSWNKADYIHNIARAVTNGDIDFAHLDTLTNEELITNLTKIKGIGKWTAEMFLMFSLGREDVFSVGDVGLQRAIQKLYGFKKKPSPKTLIRISNKWKPYRTYACRILWRSLDQK
jgi:DNA-3-methyladenine glycosylase II